MPMPQISAKALHRRLQQDPQTTVLDLRSRIEYRKGHIPGARLLPMDDMKRGGDSDWANAAGIDPEAQIYVTCHAGMGAEQAAQFLTAAGVEHPILVRGGIEAWRASGLPLKRQGNTLPLARQVQIAFGGLLILKGFLGFTVHELFFAAGTVIGVGLIVAGMTRWTGMTVLMARMPWNRDHDYATQRVGRALDARTG